MDKRFFIICATAIMAMIALPALAAPDYAKIEARVLKTHIVPAYQAFEKSTAEMVSAFQAGCTPNATHEQKMLVQARFQTALDDWESIQHVRSGPIAVNDRHSRIQFWPDKRSLGGRHLSRFLVKGSSADLEAEKFSSASIALQGFPALERLLFDDTPIPTKPLPDEALSRCDVAKAIAKNLNVIAQALAKESQVPDAFGDDPKQAVRSMVSDLITGIEVVQRLKLQIPADKTKPLPKRAESWRSARSLRNVKLNLVALRELALALNGPIGDDPESKFIFSQFDEAIATADSLGADMGVVLKAKNGPLKLRSLALTLEDTKKLVAIYMTERLSVNLGFNSLDGD